MYWNALFSQWKVDRRRKKWWMATCHDHRKKKERKDSFTPSFFLSFFLFVLTAAAKTERDGTKRIKNAWYCLIMSLCVQLKDCKISNFKLCLNNLFGMTLICVNVHVWPRTISSRQTMSTQVWSWSSRLNWN